jgi:hypothetical protein
LKDKLEAFGRNSTNRFEPVINFLKDSKEAAILAKSSDTTKIRSFFQKVGSNPLVRDRALVFSPRAPFAFVPAIPKTANKNAGGAEGGFQGGNSAPPSTWYLHFAFFGRFCVFYEFAPPAGRLSYLAPLLVLEPWSAKPGKVIYAYYFPSKSSPLGRFYFSKSDKSDTG